MKRFGVSRYHLYNVKQNWANLLSNTRSMASNELDHLVAIANQSLLSLNRWLKERDKKLKQQKSDSNSRVSTLH